MFEILRRVDVFLEDQTPGSLRAWGMDYESLGPKHPGLVYCSVTSYGLAGPYRGVPADEIRAQALGGHAHAPGQRPGEHGKSP